MIVSDCMKRTVHIIDGQATLREAAEQMVAKHIGTLPVTDAAGRLVGILPLRDLLALSMPDFVRLVEDLDFVRDFGAAEERIPDPAALERRVAEIMLPPVSVAQDSGLLRAFALLYQHDLHDLPVVDGLGRPVGILSRVDAGTAFLRSWKIERGG